MSLLILALVLSLSSTCGSRQSNAPSRLRSAAANLSEMPAAAIKVNVTANAGPNDAKVDFVKQIKPIFEARCQPCHFPGGTMYQRLPFDRQGTITALGTKLFTRLKDEKEQGLIRTFLAQQAAVKAP
jgi:hypothetical protein